MSEWIIKQSEKKKTANKDQSGMSLISLMIGITISSFLLLMISQMISTSRLNYNQTQNMIGLYDTGREAIEFLKANVAMAGYGILQPLSMNNTVVPSLNATPAPGGFAVIPDWVYIGTYNDNSSSRVFPTGVSGANSGVPQGCAALMDQNYSNIQFFGMQFCNQCWAAPANFNKANLVLTTPPTSGSCCSPSSGPCPNSSGCGSIAYGCGGWFLNEVYQKLMRHVCFGTACAGAPAFPSNVSGDVFAVVYANTGPASFVTFSGATVAPVASQPPSSFKNYEFYVNASNATLQAYDSAANATYTIASNVEYMAIMVGESDLNETYIDTNGRYFYPPTMSRYVRPNASDLYPYRVTAIRVGLVVRTQDPISVTPPIPQTINVMRGNNGAWITYNAPADGRIRRVFVTTIFLDSYKLPDYQTHCALVSGSYRMKTGGIPFAATWTTNDSCCGGNTGSACKTYDLKTCENQRMRGGCW